MKEIWKDIEGYEGKYQVSNLGNVKSLNYNKTKKEKLLKQSKMNNGYFAVGLTRNKSSKLLLVHRLVALTFIPNPNHYPCVNHKNEIKTDNSVDNLEWCTYEYNINYGTAIERKVATIFKKGVNKQTSERMKILGHYLSAKKVLCIETNEIFNSLTEAALNKKCHGSNISACCSGKIKTCKGYHWTYYNEELTNE